jgi:hypothetical protein
LLLFVRYFERNTDQMDASLYRKRLILQGFGLSFLLAAVLFVVTGQFTAFLVVPLGLLLGFGVGTVLDGRKPSARPAAGSTARQPGLLNRWLFNERLLVRAASLLLTGAVLLIAAWFAGYYLLPEGALLGPQSLEGSAAAPPSLGLLLAEIVGRNAIWVVVIALINLLLIPSGFGYLVPLAWCIYYGLLLGTNSFGIAMPERIAPSLVIFERAGPFELTAYLLSAAASYIRTPALKWPGKLRHISPSAWVVLVISLLMIVLAGLREALMIIERGIG